MPYPPPPLSLPLASTPGCAAQLTKTCYEFYHQQPSGLSGENYNFFPQVCHVSEPGRDPWYSLIWSSASPLPPASWRSGYPPKGLAVDSHHLVLYQGVGPLGVVAEEGQTSGLQATRPHALLGRSGLGGAVVSVLMCGSRLCQCCCVAATIWEQGCQCC